MRGPLRSRRREAVGGVLASHSADQKLPHSQTAAPDYDDRLSLLIEGWWRPSVLVHILPPTGHVHVSFEQRDFVCISRFPVVQSPVEAHSRELGQDVAVVEPFAPRFLVQPTNHDPHSYRDAPPESPLALSLEGRPAARLASAGQNLNALRRSAWTIVHAFEKGLEGPTIPWLLRTEVRVHEHEN